MAINPAKVESHTKYCTTKGFGFPILSDSDMTVVKAFGCRNALTGGVSRTVFALDTKGKIIFAERGQASYEDVLTAIWNAKG